MLEDWPPHPIASPHAAFNAFLLNASGFFVFGPVLAAV
jgi:hypothetical protein